MKLPGRPPGEVEYVFEAFGNRAEPAPAYVVFRAPNERERRTFAISHVNHKDAELARAHALRAFVARVVGLQNQAGAAVETAEQLLDHAPVALLDELLVALYRMLGFLEDEAKNSG